MRPEKIEAPLAARPLSASAVALMLMLCVSWGFNQVAVKLALPDIPVMLQATIRSSGAMIVLLLIARLRGVKWFERDGTLGPGVVAGVIFGFEFILIYRGLLLTSASRAVLFLYTAPFSCPRPRAGFFFSIPPFFWWRSPPTSFSASGCEPRNGADLPCALPA